MNGRRIEEPRSFLTLALWWKSG